MDTTSTPVNGQPEGSAEYYKRDFWSTENKKYSKPHYRMQKVSRIITKLAAGKDCALLDLGCGPAALREVLPPNVHYHGIDIAIHEPAPFLIERDFAEEPISFDGKHFDIVLAQGVFEYMGNRESQKLSEIVSLLNENGTFIVSYVNFRHRKRKIYPIYNNVHSPEEFLKSLSRHFVVSKVIPVSHNWTHSDPSRNLVQRANMHFNAKIPVISQKLAVEYFFLGRV
jgi:cyclopropane fatty-acyl-phospholipid synthase-like methyltransferase